MHVQIVAVPPSPNQAHATAACSHKKGNRSGSIRMLATYPRFRMEWSILLEDQRPNDPQPASPEAEKDARIDSDRS